MSRQTVVPFGPQHPVLPEPIQVKLTLQDETIVSALPGFGYCHRGIEKAAELNDLSQNVFLLERVCGICSFMHAMTYCQGIEELMGVEIPERAKYLRVIWSEIQRLHSHLLWIGCFTESMGFESLFMQSWRYREKILDLQERTSGHRVILSTCTLGGVRRDISEENLEVILNTLKELKSGLDQLAGIIERDYTLHKRCVGIGTLSKEQARSLGVVGPMIRASGIAQDARMLGYAAYGNLKFEPVVETAGDSHARTMVRIRETFQSIDLIRQAIDKMPQGEISVKLRGNPTGEVVSRVEQPRGEVVYFIKGNGTKNLERLRVRTPTYANAASLVVMLPGMTLADVPILLHTIDPCFSCTER